MKTKTELIPYRKGELWGYCNSEKKIVVPCKYHKVVPLNNNIAWVCYKNKWGTIDSEGNTITPCDYIFNQNFEHILRTVQDNIFVAEFNNKYVLFDYSGNILKTFDYDNISGFKYGLASIYKNGKSGFINKNGEVVIPCIYDNYQPEFNEGLSILYREGFYYIVNIKGEKVSQLKCDCLFKFSNGLARFENIKKKLWFTENRYGYIDSNGQEIVQPIYEEADDFKHGFAVTKLKGKWGVTDITGKVVFPFKYDEVKVLKNNLFLLYDNRRKSCFFVNANGSVILEFFNDMICSEITNDQGEETDYYILSNGFANGIIDSKCQKYREFFAGQICNISEGLVLVKSTINDLFGYLNLNGNIVIPFEYSYLDRFNNGFAVYSCDGNDRYGYIDISGWKLTSCIYDDAQRFQNGIALVAISDNYGYIDINGNEYWED